MNKPLGQLARIGVQLYTVRSLMENDFAGTLERVAGLGYQEVEFAGYYGHQPEDVKALLDQLGLVAPAAHVGLAELRTNLSQVMEDARTIGHEYIVCPYLEEEERTTDGYKKLAEDLRRFGSACEENGLRLAYHNHDFEFERVGGMIPMDMLLEETDPEQVHFELDLYWITFAGHDPLDYFERYPGRFPLCHVKDMADRMGTPRMVPVGEGEIDFGNIFAHAGQGGLKHFFVEHDLPQDPIASIQTSYNNLAALTF